MQTVEVRGFESRRVHQKEIPMAANNVMKIWFGKI